ncbi:MAG: MarR family transcriptional regulator [Proteobacteria bacterium]|nr:MarR family transcriptional regulator [Pseudomonadota bacterium]
MESSLATTPPPSTSSLDQPGNREALALWHKVLLESVKAGSFDLSARQVTLTLTVYLEAGPHTVRSLAAQLGISKPAVCRAIDTLSKHGLVARKEDKQDRRNVFIERTETGRTYLTQFSESILNHLMEIA